MKNPCINCITLPVCKQIAKAKKDDIDNAHLSDAGKLRVLTYSMSIRCELLFDYAVKLINLREDSEGDLAGQPAVINERARIIFKYLGVIK